MKWVMTVLFFVAALVLSSRVYAAPATAAVVKKVSCRVETGDIGTISVKGESLNDAQGKAAEECYMRREALFEKGRAQKVDMDRGQDLIDSCINIKCG